MLWCAEVENLNTKENQVAVGSDSFAYDKGKVTERMEIIIQSNRER